MTTPLTNAHANAQANSATNQIAKGVDVICHKSSHQEFYAINSYVALE
jgi:hypothetical protein